MSTVARKAARTAVLAGIIGAIGIAAAWRVEAEANGPPPGPPGAAAAPALSPWLRLAPGEIVPEQRFGAALATWGNTALVGAPGLGAAYTFAPAHGPQLAEEAALAPAAPEPGFGAAVAVWGDTALIGAPGAGAASTPGVVHVYVRGEQGWQEQAVLTAADGEAGDAFGAAVALSGDTAIVGAPFADGEGAAPGAGAAYVFTRRGQQWTEQARLVAVDAPPGAALGASVAAYANTVVAGAPYADGQVPASGAAYVFTRDAGAWTAAAKLDAAEGGALARFGAAVALDGDTAAVGAPDHDGAGAAYVFERDGARWEERAELTQGNAAARGLGSSIALRGDALLVGSARPDQPPAAPGRASLFERRDGTWRFARRVIGGSAEGADGFGVPVALTERHAFIGAASDSADAPGAGAVYAYRIERATLEASTLSCGSATTLNALAVCIRNQMPLEASEGFVIPTLDEETDWRVAVTRMLAGECGFALPATLDGIMQVRTFTDSDNGKSYCVLMEVEDADSDGYVDRGWGTFLVDTTAVRDLGHNAPHPRADNSTEAEAIDVFKLTDSRTYLMCGAHRRANAAASACDVEYAEADCAHARGNMYYPTIQELDRFYDPADHTQIEWHGKASTTCSGIDAYLSPGLNATPPAGSEVLALEASVELQHPDWVVDVPGAGTCGLNGTDNNSGRFLNGVADEDVCATAATAATGRYMQIEQDLEQRDGTLWSPAVRETWPLTAPPVAPTGLAATPASAQVRLSWVHASGADTYRIWTSGVTGGPWSEVASGVTGTSYTHAGLTNGLPYYYVVSAVNPVGEGPRSAEVVATPMGAPAPPQGLTATAGKRKVTLRWAGSAGATSYRWKRAAVSGGPYLLVRTVTGTSATDGSVTAGVTYYYVVTAVNGNGESANSTEAWATPY